MEVNNAIYQTLGHLWWSEDAGFELTSLRFCMNPVRYGYFRRILEQLAIAGRAVLDIGYGGGYLAEAFAADGFQVTGVDPSSNSIAAARRHAAETGLQIRYQEGRGECLPFGDETFDIVCCCDVLEHVDDVGQVLHEAARTLKPGGLFLLRHGEPHAAQQAGADQGVAGLESRRVRRAERACLGEISEAR